MKYLKLYENLNEPQIGDYVICSENFEKCKNFIENNIGQIVMIKPPFSVFGYLVKYENIPSGLDGYFINLYGEMTTDTDIAYRCMNKDEFLIIDKNIEDIKIKLMAKKYNI
jgi:hypothetical protein